MRALEAIQKILRSHKTRTPHTDHEPHQEGARQAEPPKTSLHVCFFDDDLDNLRAVEEVLTDAVASVRTASSVLGDLAQCPGDGLPNPRID